MEQNSTAGTLKKHLEEFKPVENKIKKMIKKIVKIPFTELLCLL